MSPFLTFIEPVRLTGAEKEIKQRTYLYAETGRPTVFTRFYEAVKNDPGWRVQAVSGGHVVMIDLLTKLLLEELER
jgi:hypothetical protein